MELSFENILYDNSAKKPKNQVDDNTRESYPGEDELKVLLNTNFGSFTSAKGIYEININGRIVRFVVRYRGYSEKAEENKSWGGIPKNEPLEVFAIREKIDQGNSCFSLYKTDSDFVNKKIANRKGNSKSWGISKEDKISPFNGPSIKEINEEIVLLIKKLSAGEGKK